MNLGIQVRDLFNTYVSRSNLDGTNFDFQRENDPRGPSLVFSASYRINNYRAKSLTTPAVVANFKVILVSSVFKRLPTNVNF